MIHGKESLKVSLMINNIKQKIKLMYAQHIHCTLIVQKKMNSWIHKISIQQFTKRKINVYSYIKFKEMN